MFQLVYSDVPKDYATFLHSQTKFDDFNLVRKEIVAVTDAETGSSTGWYLAVNVMCMIAVRNDFKSVTYATHAIALQIEMSPNIGSNCATDRNLPSLRC